ELQIARDWSQRRTKGETPARDESFIEESAAEDRRQRAQEQEREQRRHAAELAATQARELAAQQAANAARRLAHRTALGLVAAMVLFAVAAVAYVLAREARDEALLNQSKLLAARAKQETEQGDPATGILLALEALPDATSDERRVRHRPY